MKKNIPTIILISLFLIGLSLLLYPTISDYWNSYHQSEAVVHYANEVNDLNEEEYTKMLQGAHTYNENLLNRDWFQNLNEDEKKVYEKTLDITGTGIMGYIEIPSIHVSLPIYHGTDEASLQVALGHLEWSSLPVGGPSTHTVISGHRGLPSAKLLTDLDQLREGDIFTLNVLNETLTYEVDQILIVEPTEVDSLNIEEGKDLCTLVTCTPYGINTHRLLVRGHRIENLKDGDTSRIVADAIQIEPLVVAPIIACVILFILFIFMMKRGGKGGKGEKD